MTSIERLDTFFAYKRAKDKKLTDNRICIMCELSVGALTNSRKRKSVTYKTVKAVSQAFPDLNPDWVMTGDGAMLKGNENLQMSKGEKNIIVEYLEGKIRELENENFELKKEVERLQIFAQKKRKR